MSAKTSTGTQDETLTRAHDIMTEAIVSARPDKSVHAIATLLLDKRINAVPVVNGDGVPIGMVSDGDLIGRSETQRLARNDWWLTVMSGEQIFDDNFKSRLLATDRTASDIMSAPLVTVTEDTEVSEIARLLAIQHIKRVPIVRGGRIVGIVSASTR